MTEALEKSYEYCHSLAKRTARNFYFSFLGLPPDKFRAMCALYAFMRVSDDIGDDETVPLAERAANLANWQESLACALGESDEVTFANGPASREWPAGETKRCSEMSIATIDSGFQVFPALADVVTRFEIPSQYLHAVIDGIRMDLQPAPFDSFEELSTYCYHVAGAVGQCCIHIWGFTDERALACAADCGMAFQLTNILRDLAEDIEMGRVYLPQDDLKQFEYTAQDMAAHCCDDRFRRLMEFETARAWSYYEKSEALFEYLSSTGRPILRAMIRIYGGLLTEIERRDYDVFRERISLPTWRKLLIAADAVLHRQWR